MPTTILVATDLTQETQRLLEWAMALPHGDDARIVLLHVVDVEKHIWAALSREYSVESVRDKLLGHARAALAEFHQDDVAPLSIESQVHWGDTVSLILEAAKAEQADLIVIGRHGPRTVGQFTLGGTADKILRRAECPVTVMPMD